MGKEILEYLSKYIDLTEDEVKIIIELNLVRKFKKGSILLREGEVSKVCYMVLCGCVRSYYLVDGEEKTTAFYTEHQPITSVSYVKGTPSEYYLACVEDCILSMGSAEKTSTIFEKIPKFEALSHKIASELLADKQVQFDNFMSLTPEQRYLKLLDARPDLFNRAPQYQLASYLGIKPESLSRIRKRITGNKK